MNHELRRLLLKEINTNGDPLTGIESFLSEVLEMHAELRINDQPVVPQDHYVGELK